MFMGKMEYDALKCNVYMYTQPVVVLRRSVSGLFLQQRAKAASTLINCSLFLFQQDNFPWDERTVYNLAIGAAGMTSAFFYFYFRETGVQISWKDFVHHYLSRGLVSHTQCFS